MNLVDSKFIGLISPRLEKFKKVKPNLYNFRCPICGDSKKNKSKTRGYLYNIKADINFRCHNCGASMSFSNFLKQIDTTLHKQYVMEKFKDGFAGVKGGSAIEKWSDFSAVNTWQEFSYDFSDSIDNENTTLVLFFNAGQNNGNPEDIYHIDELRWEEN